MSDQTDKNVVSSGQVEQQTVDLVDFAEYSGFTSGKDNKESNAWNNTVTIIAKIQDTVIANPEELTGSSYTNLELRKDAKIIGSMLTGANLIDAVCSQSLLNNAFGGEPFGVFLALATNLIILKIKNDAGIAIVRARPGAFLTRAVGTFSLLGLSTLSCSISGVGTELTLNQSGLADTLASQIIEKGKVRIAALKPDTSLYDRAQAECDESKKQLDQLPGTGARHNTKYVLTYGMFGERNRIWKLTESGIPLCPKADLLKQQVVEQSANLSKEWEKKMSTRSQIGNDLEFLKQEMPGQYKKYFTDYSAPNCQDKKL